MRNALLPAVSRWRATSTMAASSSTLFLSAQIGLIAVVCWFFFFHALAGRELWSSHEARAAQHAQRMLDDRSFGLPRLFDDRYDYQKPPMYYWLVAGITWLRGGRVDAWSVRLPAALAATGCVFLIWGWLRRRGRPVAAWISALVLATMVHFTWLGRTGRIDMPLAFCVALAILTLPTRRWFWLGGLAIAGGLLLKGPIGFVLPVTVVMATGFQPVQRQAGSLSRAAVGAAIGLALGISWFVWANAETNGEFFRVFFWYHNVQRALGDAETLAVHPWWYYGPRLLVDALPWSLAIPVVIVQFIRNRDMRSDHGPRLGLTWLIVIVAILSFAKFKRADYLLPAYPGLALMLGCGIERISQQWSAVRQRYFGIAFAACIVAAAVAWMWRLHVDLPKREPQREQRTFARHIREAAPQPQVILFFRAEAHDLAFHLGRPLNTFLEWENLDVWASRPGPNYIVMPPECAAEWSRHVHSGKLEEIARNTDFSAGWHEKPLVLLRTVPGNADAAPRQQARHRQGADQRRTAGSQR